MATSSQVTKAPPLNAKALFYMGLLAMQIGVQPTLIRIYAPTHITSSTIVLMQETTKFFIAFFMLYVSGAWKTALEGWSIRSWLTVAGIPAALYTVQNIAALRAYQNLDALTFNVLNQTKTLSAALCCYLVMGRRQSPLQIVALVFLLVAALMMEDVIPVNQLFQRQDSATKTETGSSSSTLLASEQQQPSQQQQDETFSWDAHHITNGVLPVLLASFISGLAGALSQKSLQAAHNARNSYLFSMELCAATILLLSSSLTMSADGAEIAERGFWKNWTVWTWIPIVTGAGGGVLVGLVTSYAGAVRKGFSLIFGMLLSGIVQAVRDPAVGVAPGQICAGFLAAVSLYLHATNPPEVETTTTKQKSD